MTRRPAPPKPVSEMSEEEFNAHFGLDGDELERIAEEYETDSFPLGTHTSGGPGGPGRPRLYGEAMSDLHVRVPASVLERIDALAQRNGTNRSAYVRALLEAAA